MSWMGAWPRRGLVASAAPEHGRGGSANVDHAPASSTCTSTMSPAACSAAAGQYELDYWGVSVAETTRKLATKLARRGEATPPPALACRRLRRSHVGILFHAPVPDRGRGEKVATADFIIDLCPCEFSSLHRDRAGQDQTVVHRPFRGLRRAQRKARAVTCRPRRGADPGFGKYRKQSPRTGGLCRHGRSRRRPRRSSARARSARRPAAGAARGRAGAGRPPGDEGRGGDRRYRAEADARR